jgi:hypothetical protein
MILCFNAVRAADVYIDLEEKIEDPESQALLQGSNHQQESVAPLNLLLDDDALADPFWIIVDYLDESDLQSLRTLSRHFYIKLNDLFFSIPELPVKPTALDLLIFIEKAEAIRIRSKKIYDSKKFDKHFKKFKRQMEALNKAVTLMPFSLTLYWRNAYTRTHNLTTYYQEKFDQEFEKPSSRPALARRIITSVSRDPLLLHFVSTGVVLATTACAWFLYVDYINTAEKNTNLRDHYEGDLRQAQLNFEENLQKYLKITKNPFYINEIFQNNSFYNPSRVDCIETPQYIPIIGIRKKLVLNSTAALEQIPSSLLNFTVDLFEDAFSIDELRNNIEKFFKNSHVRNYHGEAHYLMNYPPHSLMLEITSYRRYPGGIVELDDFPSCLEPRMYSWRCICGFFSASKLSYDPVCIANGLATANTNYPDVIKEIHLNIVPWTIGIIGPWLGFIVFIGLGYYF